MDFSSKNLHQVVGTLEQMFIMKGMVKDMYIKVKVSLL